MKRFNRIFCLLITTMMFAGFLAGCEYGDKETDKQEQVYDENNVGEIYYQEVDLDHIAESDEGIQYADNEILIVAKDGVSKSDIEKLSEKYNAEIVGYIEQTGDYQLKLSEAMSMDELESVISEFESNDFVDSATLNYVTEMYEDNIVNYNINHGHEWNENINDIKDRMWGVEAINAPLAWYAMDLLKENIEPVKVGLIDGGFDTDHEDLGFAENGVFYDDGTNSSKNRNVDTDATNDEKFHGTHVAGTMAARGDNEDGICGIYPYGNDRLYGVSTTGIQKYQENSVFYKSVMIYKIGYAELILRKVKIINQSQGFNWSTNWEKYKHRLFNTDESWNDYCSKLFNDVNFQERYKQMAKSLSDFLNRTLDKGYDFVIVCSAGNDSNPTIGNIESKYNSWITLIEDDKNRGTNDNLSDIYDRIIVVGSIGKSYEINDFSNAGNRVDVFAPGERIYGTVAGGRYGTEYTDSKSETHIFSGTSMASPHVAGVAADVWSMNKYLTGSEVKEIICSSTIDDTVVYTTPNGEDRGVVDANKAVREAYNRLASSGGVKKEPENGAILSYVVKSENEERIPNATVVAISDTTNEEFSANTDSDGHFELIAPAGTYLLKITADGYSDYELEKVSVSNGEVNYIDWIKMSPALTSFSVPDSMVMTIGELGVIEPNVEPSDAYGYSLKWTTSDDSIVQIASDSGEKCILTAKSKGTATVTAEAAINGKAVSHSTEVRVASKARDTVLVLDVSGSMGGTPLEEMKKSAIQFCEELLTDEFNNRVGLVLYDSDIETYDLTNDVTALESYINDIADGGSTDMESGISRAVEMLDGLSTDDSIKNIVIMADGLPNRGNTSESGSMPVSGSYSYYSSDISYANAVIDTAQSAMSKYNLYSLGFFHDLYGEEKDFAVTLMQSLTNMNDGYHEVDQAENLQFAFGDISEEISDGSKIVINIACPVDVSVSYQGEALSSSQSNYNDKTSFGSLQLLGKNQDVKVVSVDSDKVYDISLSGTDEGAMDYSVNYFDDTEKLIDSRSFTNIPITNTTKISSSTENSAEVSLNIDSDGDGVSDIIYSAKQNSVGDVAWQSEPETEPTTELTTEYIEPSTEAMQSAYKNSLETWQIILLVLGITVAIGIVIVAVVLVVIKDKTDDLYDLPVDPVISDSKPNNDNESEALETKPLTSNSATIRILSGSMKGKEFLINNDENVLIGKKSGLTKVLLSNDYEMVSRVHCTVSYSEKLNKFFVTDSSKNGTYYENHIRLVKGKRTPLVPGSIILLADDNCRILLK